jgi:hypothetical protein
LQTGNNVIRQEHLVIHLRCLVVKYTMPVVLQHHRRLESALVLMSRPYNISGLESLKAGITRQPLNCSLSSSVSNPAACNCVRCTVPDLSTNVSVAVPDLEPVHDFRGIYTVLLSARLTLFYWTSSRLWK